MKRTADHFSFCQFRNAAGHAVATATIIDGNSMRDYKVKPVVFAVMTVAAVATAAGCNSGNSTGGFDVDRSFNIPLTTTEEVPTPKPSPATGTAEVVIYPQEIQYRLSATSMMNVIQAHIHVGAPGVAGPIVVGLFLSAAGGTGPISGQFARGSITAGSLTASVSLDSLKNLLKSGNSYVNVHTILNPAGEIRGQVR